MSCNFNKITEDINEVCFTDCDCGTQDPCDSCGCCGNCGCGSCGCCNDCCNSKPTCSTPKAACCTGIKADRFDSSKAQTIIAYVDKIFDGKLRQGSALIESVDTITPVNAYTVNSQFSPINCCTGTTANITVGTTFVVESVESELLEINLVTLASNLVFINGATVPEALRLESNRYSIGLAQRNLVPLSNEEGAGTKSSLMLSGIGEWSYKARHKITGKANSQGQVNNFCITVENITSHTMTGLNSTLLIPEICIPSMNSRVQTVFDGKVTMLNPVITVTASTIANAAPIINVQSNIVITPEVVAEVIETQRVWMNVIM